MKKTFNKILSFIFVLIFSFSCWTAFYSVNTSTSVNAATESYTIANHYAYRLSERIDKSPDSFESWVKVNKNSTKGGVIMGNYFNWSNGYPGCVNWEVTPDGYIRLYWNLGSLDYTFTQAGKVNDGVWHHIAVIRDKAENYFYLYIDGVLKGAVYSIQKDAVSEMEYSIGVDYRNWQTTAYDMTKTPLDGYIRQVTLYNGAITSSRIASDMNNKTISDNDTNATLIGNWYLGDPWTGNDVADSNGSEVNAVLTTWEKYVDVPDGFFDTSTYDYMFIGMPDIQTIVRYRDVVSTMPNTCQNMMTWIANNKEALKIKFMVQVGDLSDSGDREDLFSKAAEIMEPINNVGLPWTFCQGNHDYDKNCSAENSTRGSEYFNKYFSYSQYSSYSWFGGAYEEGTMSNTYQKIEIGDVKYLIVNLEFGPRRSVIRWAKRVIDKHPDYRVIVNTHCYVDSNGELNDANSKFPSTSYGWASVLETTHAGVLYDDLISQCPNIFMVFSGHVPGDDIKLRQEKGVFGNTINSWMINNQVLNMHGNSKSGITGIGEDTMLCLTVNETTRKIRCCWFSSSENAQMGLQNYYEIDF